MDSLELQRFEKALTNSELDIHREHKRRVYELLCTTRQRMEKAEDGKERTYGQLVIIVDPDIIAPYRSVPNKSKNLLISRIRFSETEAKLIFLEETCPSLSTEPLRKPRLNSLE